MGGNRQKKCGISNENLKITKNILDIVFDIKLSEKQIILVLVAMRLTRAKSNKRPDSIIDYISYLAMSLNKT